MELLAERSCGGPVAKVVFHPHHPLLLAIISGSWEIAVMRWDSSYDLRVESKFNRHEPSSNLATLDFFAVDAAFDPASGAIVVTDGDGINVWSEQRVTRRLPGFYRCDNIAISPDGAKLIAGAWLPPKQRHKPPYNARLAAAVIDLRRLTPLSYFYESHRICFSEARDIAIALQGEQCTTNVRFIRTHSHGTELFKKKLLRDDTLIDVALSRSADRFATVGNISDITLEVWRFPSLERIGSLQWPVAFDITAAPFYFSRQVRFVAPSTAVLVDPSGQLVEVDTERMAIVGSTAARCGRAGTLDYHLDLGLLVSGAEDGMIRLWSHSDSRRDDNSSERNDGPTRFEELYPSHSWATSLAQAE